MPGFSGKSLRTLVGVCLTASAAMAQPAPLPPATRLEASSRLAIGNGVMRAVIYPPGENAFYRGTRFDQSGVIGSLTYGSQEYYGPWYNAIQPSVRDLSFGPE